MKKRRQLGLLAATCLCLATFSPARAGFVTIANPGDADPLGGTYVSATSKLAISSPVFTNLSSLSDSTLTTSFSSPLQVLQVPLTWDTWSSPPFSENANPTVLWSQGLATITLTFSKPVTTFGFELEPNDL